MSTANTTTPTQITRRSNGRGPAAGAAPVPDPGR